MAPDRGKYARLGDGRGGAGGAAQTAARRPRAADPPARAVHVGPGLRRGGAPPRGAGVPARGRGTVGRGGRAVMATVKIPDEGKTVSGFEPVRRGLVEVGIAYQRWEPSHPGPSG